MYVMKHRPVLQSASESAPHFTKAITNFRQSGLHGVIRRVHHRLDLQSAFESPPRRRSCAPASSQARDGAIQAAREDGEDGLADNEEEELSGDDTDDDVEYFELPSTSHLSIHDAFNAALATDLRAYFVSRFSDPLRSDPSRYVWDYWHVPGQYSLLRTPAHAFFPRDLYDRLEDALIRFGEEKLGCRGISPMWLSYYVDGMGQGMHSDAPHGPWAFVLSLTEWEGREFNGGETAILRPEVLNYWQGFVAGVGMETPQLVRMRRDKSYCTTTSI
jgi:hypothetical protein